MASWSQVARRIRVPLGFAFAVVYFWLARPTALSIVAGACITALGLVLRAIASGHVQKNEQLATSGPYAYLRNPLYLGSLIIGGGFALAGRNWWIVAGIALIFAVVYFPVIRSEEAFLKAKFPEFEEYARQVPRLLPRLTAFGAAHGSFSWRLYWQHREYNSALGAALMIAALVAKAVFLQR